MKVSILYAVSNDQHPNELRKTIASAKEGIADLPHEIIVCDDQSTDGCTRGLPKDVLLVRTFTRSGCTGSRKVLEGMATGDVLVWSDPHCRYPAGSLKKMALDAVEYGGIILPKTHSQARGSRVGFGGKWEINERGLAVPKVTTAPHPVFPGLVGAIYVVRKDVFDSIGGWPHLPGYWGCADTTLGLAAWALGVPARVDTDVLCMHKYSPDRRFCFSTCAWHHAANAHFMHKALFPENYEGFWRPHLLKHPKWGSPRIMRHVDHWLKSRRFRRYAAFIAEHRKADRTEGEFFRQLLRKVPDGIRTTNSQTMTIIVANAEKRAEREDAFKWLAGQDGQMPVTSALDVGAGDCIGMEMIASQHPGARVYGVDIVPRRVEWAKKRGFDVRVGDAEKLPFMDGTFELVTCLHTLEHCVDPAAAMREINRVLKPGGRALIVVPRERRPKWKAHNCCFPKEKDLIQAVANAELDVVAVATQKIHRKQREIRLVADKLLVPRDEYVADQVRIAPGHRAHRFIRPERVDALNWLAGEYEVKLGKVLDVGPRDGYIMRLLQRKGATWVCGLELSPPAAATLREEGLDVLEGDMREMPYENGAFDFITCLHVLEHCPDPERALAEMFRVLKPGGHLYVVVPRQSARPPGVKFEAHYSFFPTVESLVDMMHGVSGCETKATLATFEYGERKVKEIRMAALKPMEP